MNASRRREIKALLGPRWTTRLRCLLGGKPLPRWGNFRRTTPFSTYFGFDRGTPVDRYYLNKFLQANQSLIAGDVLEIQTTAYTRKFGREVRCAHSLDIDPQHEVTYTCDLASCDIVASNSYDCFLLPNTLQHLRYLEPALCNALRIIRPGGVILASACGFVPLIPDGPDYWRLSGEGWKEVAHRVWPGCEIHVESYGNCLVVLAAVMGLALEELDPHELELSDPRYPVLTTIFCRKPILDRI